MWVACSMPTSSSGTSGGGRWTSSTRISWAVTTSRSRASIAWKSSKDFGLVLVERVALGVAAEADHLAEMVELDQVLAPEMVEGLQQHGLLDLAHDLGGEADGALGGDLVGGARDALVDLLVGDALFLRPLLERQIEVEDLLDGLLEAFDVPLLGIGLLRDVTWR